MRPRVKIALAAAVISAGVLGAYIFRKPPVEGDADESEAVVVVPEQSRNWQPAGPVAPHLLGRIDSVSTAIPPAASEPLQPTPGDPEIHADRADSGISTPPGMPAAPPWSGGEASTTPARMTSAPIGTVGMEDPGSPAGGRKHRTHRIADGDTLARLSLRYFGTADRADAIYAANQHLLTNPDVLPIGALLQIPDPAALAAQTEETATDRMVDIPSDQLKAAREKAQAPAKPAGKTYQVKAGDTLAEIARQVYGEPNRYREILEANRDQLHQPEDLREGMVLAIP